MPWNIILFVIATGLSACAQNWKPISGSPTSFSIRQSHPAVGEGSSSTFATQNTIVDTTGAEESISYNGNDFSADAISTGFGDESFGTGYDDIKSKVFSSTGFAEDTCSVDKYAFDYEGTVQYKHHMPKMDQFTLCVWMRFTNHSGDHTLFTYSVDEEPREIQFWIANSKGSSYISMAVHGQSLYRLNYPLKMRVWHHACSSWNGKTGEWQLWVKAERVGRGFHNRIVGHTIEANGLAFSGGPSITGHTAESLHFELTLLQIYKVALSAGKAHRDHKHHHVHRFDHNGPVATTPSPPPTMATTRSPNPLLANGQIPSRVRINLAGASTPPPPPNPPVPSQVVGGVLPQPNNPLLSTNFVNGQFNSGDRFLTQQFIASFVPSGAGRTSQQSPVIFPGQPSQPTRVSSGLFASLGNGAAAGPTAGSGIIGGNIAVTGAPTGAGFSDNDSGSRFIFKRDTETKKHRSKPIEKKLNKRGLVMLDDGSIIDDSLLASGYVFEGLAQFGLPAFKEDLQKRMNIDDEIKEHDKEPAEDEVRAVIEVCTSCDIEPFKGAVALTWKNLHVSLDGALKGRSVGGCGYF